MSAETHGWNKFETQGSEMDEIRMTEAWNRYLGEKALANSQDNSPKSNVWILQETNSN